MVIAIILKWLTNLSGLPAIIAGRKLRPALWYCALVSFVFDVGGYLLKTLAIPRLWASNLFFLLEFLIISSFFVGEVFPAKRKRILWLLVTCVALYFTINSFRKGILHANYVDAALLYGLYIAYSIYGLYKVILEIEYVMVEKNPLFIFCVAILLYASGSFVVFLFENVLVLPLGKLVDDLWVYVHNILNIIKNLLIAYGLVLINKKKWDRSL